MTLYNIAESLILEVASKSTIMDCMVDRRIAEVYYDDDEDGLMLVATEDYFIRASHREKLVFEVEEVIHLLF